MTTGAPRAPRLAGRLPRVPFLATPPLHDLAWLIALLPVFWVLGIEQFAAPPLLAIAALKSLVARRGVRVSATLLVLLATLGAYAISALFIEEPLRYATFGRSYLTHVSAFLIVLIVTNGVRSWRDLRPVALALVAFLAVAGALGLLGASGIVRPAFRAPVGLVLPSSLADTEYGRLLTVRRTGNDTWFLRRTVFRPSSFFLYANLFAVAIATALPLLLHAVRRSRSFARLAYVGVAAVLLANLVLTTSRATWVAFAAGGVVWLVLARSGGRRALVLGVMLVAVAVAAAFVPAGTVQAGVERFAYARGPGSTTERLAIYSATLAGFAERPIFGWGSERDADAADGPRYPLGSHSTYLGALYKHGTVGLALLLGLWLALWWDTRRRPLHSAPQRDLLALGRWSIVVVVVVSAATSLDLDATLMIVVWTVFALLIAVGRSPALAEAEARSLP